MSNLINCLKLLQNTHDLATLSRDLNLNKWQVLELLGIINENFENLVKITSPCAVELTKSINWLDVNVINNYLNISGVYNYNIIVLDEVNSTNNYALEHIASMPHQTVVTCEYQTKGKGTKGRSWISRIACDLTFSIVYRFLQKIQLGLLPLISSIALVRVFLDYNLCGKIKWPNDIYFNNINEDGTIYWQKIAGILVELVGIESKKTVVIGVGVDNILETERNQFLALLIFHINKVLDEYCTYGFKRLKVEWLANCLHFNEKIMIKNQDSGQLIKGRHVDLLDDGRLVLMTANGTLLNASLSASLIFPAL